MAHLENVGRRSSQRVTDFLLKSKSKQLWLQLEPWLPALVIVLSLTLWECLSRLGWISVLFFPAPSYILETLLDLIIDGKLAPQLGATLWRLSLGILFGCIPGYLLGLSMGWSPRIRTVVDPLIAAIHPIPKLAIFPLIMIIFGIGENSKIVAIAVAAFFPMLINSMAGVRQITPVYFEVTQNFGANLWKTFSRVIIPGSLPVVLSGTRIAINTAIVITIAVELLTAKAGLGVMIWFAWQTLRIEELYASIIVIGLLGLGANFTLQKVSNRLAPWYNHQSEKQR